MLNVQTGSPLLSTDSGTTFTAQTALSDAYGTSGWTDACIDDNTAFKAVLLKEGNIIGKDGAVVGNVAVMAGLEANKAAAARGDSQAMAVEAAAGAYAGCKLDERGNIIDKSGKAVAHSDALKGYPAG